MTGSIVVVVAGLLVTVTGVLGRLGRLPRNRLAGVRTSSTMRSDQAFVAGNRVAGLPIALGGLAAVAGGVLSMFRPDPGVYLVAGIAVMVALTVYGGVRGSQAASRIAGGG